MIDTEQILQEQEIQQPQEQVQEQEAQQAPQQQQPTEQQLRFKDLRERAARAERERDEAIRLAQELKARQQQEPEENIGIGDEDIVDGKHLKKMYSEVRQLKKELNSYKQQSTSSHAEIRLKNEFPDFDRVVTAENVELLAQLYPPIAETLRNSNDLYNTGYSAYKMIKQFNIDQSSNNQAAIIDKNLSKPRSSLAVAPQSGSSPLARANAFENGLTDDLKQQLLKEMNAYRKMR